MTHPALRCLTVLLALPLTAALASDDSADAWRIQLEAALAAHFPAVSGCTLEPLELFSLVVDGNGAVLEAGYEGFDAAERQACLAESFADANLPPPGDTMRHTVDIRVEDPEMGMPFAVEAVGLHCDDQVVDLTAHEAVFAGGANDIRRCQLRRLILDRTLRGEVLLAYTVQPDGSVSEVVVRDSGLEDPRAEACIAERVSWLWFPEPSGACTVTLEQRLDFDLPGLLAREADVAERVAEIKPGSILACGEKPDEEGAPTLVVKIHVVAGSVETATVPERYFVEEAVADCLVGQARGWTFDGVTEGRSVVHFRLEEPLVLPD